MSATRSLTGFYGSFFWGCADVAICPYTLTIKAFMDPSQPRTEDFILGVGACVFLSTLVPVLPAITSMTFAIASFAISLALASMFIAYPIAILADAIDSCENEHQFDNQFVF